MFGNLGDASPTDLSPTRLLAIARANLTMLRISRPDLYGDDLFVLAMSQIKLALEKIKAEQCHDHTPRV